MNTHTLPNGTPCKLLKGRSLPDPPKTWKLSGHIDGPTGSRYNGTIRLYTAKDGTLRWEQYRDGCFFAYYGKVEPIPERVTIICHKCNKAHPGWCY